MEENTTTKPARREPSLWRSEVALLAAIFLIALAAHLGIKGLY